MWRTSSAGIPLSSGKSTRIGRSWRRAQLPAATALPDCRVCGSQFAFFFQVAPPGGILAGRLLSVWCCMQCADDDTFIPERPEMPLPGVELPDGFLERYQTFFRLLVVPLEASQPRPDYQPRVAYRAIALVPVADDAEVDRLGGEPSWLLDDEAPGSCHGAGLQFVLQVMEDRSFDLVPVRRTR